MKSMDKTDILVESYINGNISFTKKALKNRSKLEVLDFTGALADYYGTPDEGDYRRAIAIVAYLLS